jgi:hypothetical protein
MTRSIRPGTSCCVLSAFCFAALAGCGSGSAIGSGGVVGGGGVARAGGTSASGGTTGTGGSVTDTGCAPGWTLCCGQCLSPSAGLCGPCLAPAGASATGGTPSSGGISTGGFVGTGGNGGTVGTGSGNCTFVAGGTLPAVDQVTALTFSTATTIASNPAPPVYVTVTDAAKAQDAYAATLALPVFPPGTYACPFDFGVTYQLTFLLANGSSLGVIADPTGCQNVSIPGTCARSAMGTTFWSELSQDLGVPESEIDTFFLSASQPDGGADSGVTCTTARDCPPGLSCGYAVSDGCAAKGVCVQSNCQGSGCLTPAGMCGCDGQTILPIQSQSTANSITITYASAPSSGKNGPCTNNPVPDAAASDGERDLDARVPLQHRSTSTSCPSQRGPAPQFCNNGVPCTSQPYPSSPYSTCSSDSQCTGGLNGCFPETMFTAGGCSYDECSTDSACGARTPCLCRSSSTDNSANVCDVGGNCAVDSDCGPGGYCSPSIETCYSTNPEAVVEGSNLGGPNPYYCHTASDLCINDSDCEVDAGTATGTSCPTYTHCAYSVQDTRWECTQLSCCGV